MAKATFLAALMAAGLVFQAQAADGFKLAITGPFSGGSAPMGASMRDGAKLAIAELNAKGGLEVGGKKLPIEVIERDDEAKNERGALIAQELASLDNLSAVIGTVNTGVALAGDKFLQEKKVVKIITPAAGSASMTQWTNPPVQDLYIFRFAAADDIQSAMVVEEAARRNLTKVAVLHDATNYGVSGRNDLMRQIEAQGKLTVVATEKFNIGDKDMSAQLLRAKAAGAQAVLIWGIGPELAAVANDMNKVGFKVPLIGGWPLSMSNFIDNAGANGDGALMPQTFIEEPISKVSTDFIHAYHSTYKVERIPSPVSAAQGYDAVMILAAAVRQAGSTEATKIRDALEDLKEPVAGVITTWKKPYAKWDPTRPQTHEAFRREDAVMGMVKGGRVVFANGEDRERLMKR